MGFGTFSLHSSHSGGVRRFLCIFVYADDVWMVEAIVTGYLFEFTDRVITNRGE